MSNLYTDILRIARNYMGIAAKEYIDRRCRIVLSGSEPEEITLEKLDRLIAGIEMTAKVYMSEGKVVAFIREIEELKNNRY